MVCANEEACLYWNIFLRYDLTLAGPGAVAVGGGAVVGAFIAFGAMIAGTLYRTLSGASELTDELTKSTENLHESTDELNGALKQLAILQAAQMARKTRTLTRSETVAEKKW